MKIGPCLDVGLTACVEKPTIFGVKPTHRQVAGPPRPLLSISPFFRGAGGNKNKCDVVHEATTLQVLNIATAGAYAFRILNACEGAEGRRSMCEVQKRWWGWRRGWIRATPWSSLLR